LLLLLLLHCSNAGFLYTISYPCTGLDKPLGLQKSETPRISRYSAYKGGKVVNPTHRPRLYLGAPLVLISIKSFGFVYLPYVIQYHPLAYIVTEKKTNLQEHTYVEDIAYLYLHIALLHMLHLFWFLYTFASFHNVRQISYNSQVDV
jgi:hypothetical protein